MKRKRRRRIILVLNIDGSLAVDVREKEKPS